MSEISNDPYKTALGNLIEAAERWVKQREANTLIDSQVALEALKRAAHEFAEADQ